MPVTIVDANYPDWRRVTWEGDGHDVGAIGFRGEYIQTACKIAKLYDKQAAFKMQFKSTIDAVRITFKDSSSTFHVMPCRF
ncbi:RusA-like Holliday junction resolvase [Edwardsiella phage PEi21]|uniref:Uncharacterized protein n=1 Tax=Edwardsiella phage PEi21 TaxID=1325372 RepID=N0DUB2_9CAUD|nr:RusA-like Holliday junction resolvase [Edwardsiella phage PEi21]BAN16862.1 hypothetical protein [Edwardsiella phage PEi21]